jgi:phytoene dehydrogenase-like protein
MKENIETTSLVWKKIAEDWETYFAEPSRISPGEEQQYKKWFAELARGKESLKGLVLGATPELRDAMVELGTLYT